ERHWDLPDGGSEMRWREIKDLLTHYHLRPIVHSCYVDTNMANLDSHRRQTAVRQNLRCLKFAAFLEAEYLVVHPGNLSRKFPPPLLPDARDCLQQSLKSLTAQAETDRVTIALENGWNGENLAIIGNADEHAALIERVGSPVLKILFDIGHANTFGVDLTAYLNQVQPYLAGIHLHDNGGTKDEHLPLGRGAIHRAHFQRCFEAGVPVVLEMNSLDDISTSLAYLEANITSV
ncbi:MAG: sugar phosphate isomerase/epimerase family protein, partial [Candidatus Methylomirabilales bacterium]